MVDRAVLTEEHRQPLVVRPQQPDDFPKIIIPELYKRTKFLPFADLLEKRP